MNIKQIANSPKLWQTLTGVLTAVLSYFGYVQVADNKTDVNVEVVSPDKPHSHEQRDWLPVIRAEVEKARKSHSDAYHGGD
jgi:hypothetical protein